MSENHGLGDSQREPTLRFKMAAWEHQMKGIDGERLRHGQEGTNSVCEGPNRAQNQCDSDGRGEHAVYLLDSLEFGFLS